MAPFEYFDQRCAEARRRSYGTLQIGRFIAALLVIGFHANATLALPKYLGSDPAIPFRAGFSGVQYFFVLSGIVIAFAHSGEAGQPGVVARFAKKRAWRLLPPLWAALLLSLVLNLIVKGGDQVSFSDVVVSMLMLPSPHEPLLAVEWTLRHELLFYVTFTLCLWRPGVGLIVAGAMLILSVWGGLVSLSFPMAFYASPNHLLFALGAIVLPRVPRPRGGNAWAVLAVGLGLFALAWVITCQAAGVQADQRGLLVWLFGAGAALVIHGSLALEEAGTLRVGKLGRVLGDASYSIYLVHFLFISAASKLAVMAKLPPTVAFVFVAAVGLSGGLLFYVIAELPLRRLVGRKTT